MKRLITVIFFLVIQSTRGKDRLFVNSAADKSFAVVLEKITGERLHFFWLNPINGDQIKKEAISNKGTQFFQSLQSGYEQDWVLVLEDEESSFPSI